MCVTKVVDTFSGEKTVEVDGHPGAAVWSLAMQPDGSGFMTGGADKVVKFWEFTVTMIMMII